MKQREASAGRNLSRTPSCEHDDYHAVSRPRLCAACGGRGVDAGTAQRSSEQSSAARTSLVSELTHLCRAQFLLAGTSVMSLRSKLFGKAFQERPAVQAMAEEHKKNAGACPAALALRCARAEPATQATRSSARRVTPVRLRRTVAARASLTPPRRADMGSGKFAEQLTYTEWLAFNNAQRAHQNMLETLPGFYATLFGAGAMHPKLASWCGSCARVGLLLELTRHGLQVWRLLHRRPSGLQDRLPEERRQGPRGGCRHRWARHRGPAGHLPLRGLPAGAAA